MYMYQVDVSNLRDLCYENQIFYTPKIFRRLHVVKRNVQYNFSH